jgi:hypothetical protein
MWHGTLDRLSSSVKKGRDIQSLIAETGDLSLKPVDVVGTHKAILALSRIRGNPRLLGWLSQVSGLRLWLVDLTH